MRASENTFRFMIGGIVLAAVAVVAVQAWVVYGMLEWNAFSKSHECSVVSKGAPSTVFGITPSGKTGPVLIYGKTTYLCNDGVEYTR